MDRRMMFEACMINKRRLCFESAMKCLMLIPLEPQQFGGIVFKKNNIRHSRKNRRVIKNGNNQMQSALNDGIY